jgi:hypothetical protein
MMRAIDSDGTVPSASAAMTAVCASARRDQRTCPRAAPLLIFVRWISHEVGL